MAIGQTFVILTAGIDLSVGSILGLTVVLFGGLLQNQSLAAAIPIGLLAGAVMGMVTGFGVAYAGIPAFIMTLGMLSFGRGIAFIYTGGTPIPISDPTYYYIGNGYFAGIPIPSIILLGTLLMSSFVLGSTPFGRCVYAIGSNEAAAHLSGVPTKKCQALQFGHFASPEGCKQNSPWAAALGRRPRGNRPERAAESRGLLPKITFLESDSMPFQKLTKLFLIRKLKGLEYRT